MRANRNRESRVRPMQRRDANESAVLDLLRYEGYQCWCIEPVPNTHSQGIQDIVVADGSGRICMVEVKTRKGRLSKVQRAAAQAIGCSLVVKDAEEAVVKVAQYFVTAENSAEGDVRAPSLADRTNLVDEMQPDDAPWEVPW